MKKIAFVTPWFGENIPGGAEMALRGVTTHLHEAGVDIEILTTCVKEFASDWNENYYKPGEEIINGILVKRFRVRKRNVKAFDKVNAKLINNILLNHEEELTFVNEMVNSTELYQYISNCKEEYTLFVFIPYMFGTTYFGVKECLEKAVLIPCFHDESYLYLKSFKELYSKVAGMIFNAQPEYELANKVYNLTSVKQCVSGLGIDVSINGDANRFREKYKINAPFMIYAGRKDKGKNVDTLINYFIEFRKKKNHDIKLILIGGGEIAIPNEMKNDIIDLGFVPVQDKYDAYSAAICLCQPSKNESFSLVIMESWLCKRPVLVHNDCEVTKNFVKTSNGGLYFKDYYEFERCVNHYIENSEVANMLGKQGRKFVLDNFDWDVVVKKYKDFFHRLTMEGTDEKGRL